MVDNLNGDKLAEACRHAEHNTLYRKATTGPKQGNQSLAEAEAAAMQTFTELVIALETAQGREPTSDQLSTISGYLNADLLLVQGPPGTGKSHTLGWAVLAHIYLALVQFSLTPHTPSAVPVFRVIVSTQTHNAVEIVLASIAAKWKQLMAALASLEPSSTSFLRQQLELLASLKLYKAGGDEKTPLPAEVSYIDPWFREHVKAALDGEGLESLEVKAKAKAKSKKVKSTPTKVKAKAQAVETTPVVEVPQPQLLVIGATPGNLYNLMKEYYGRGKTKENLVWDEIDYKFFDLLVLDEASQMNLPHALLAAGWLKASGQILIVGDHRQLAPILTHGWEHEEHLPTVSARPYRSVFQYFLDSGWPRIALSESFRLHSSQAAFLATHIYSQDGVSFHSRQNKRLPALAPVNFINNGAASSNTNEALEAYLETVLHPNYPLIIIEHTEAASQQYNQAELDLITPLLTAATNRLGLDGVTGIGVVVPHRAQKAALRERFPLLAKAGAIDTVERFQGGERDLIIVSTTASDPDYVAAEAEFLLSPTRFNVALSRPRAKLIVVASHSIFQFVSARLELFEQALLWKKLVATCQQQPVWSGKASDLFPPRSAVMLATSTTAKSQSYAPFSLRVYAHS
jgi:hypothetical protein